MTEIDLEKLFSHEWSYSRLSTFKNCPHMFYIKYINDEKYEKEDKFYARYGLFVHKLIEKFYKGEIDRDDLEIEFILGFTDNVSNSSAKPKKGIVESYLKQGIDYFRSFEPFPYTTVGVEKTVHFEIDGIKFRGVIDYIGEKDGEYVIIDNKSRKLKQRSNRKKPTQNDKTLDEMYVQLYLYAEAVKAEYGKYPKSLCFNCFRNGEFIEEPFDESKLGEAKAYVLNLLDEIKEEIFFFPNPDFFFCKYLCDVSHDCSYYNA